MGFQCKETEVTFCNIHMWVLGGKHERYTHRRHLGYFEIRRCVIDLYFFFTFAEVFTLLIGTFGLE